MSSILDIDLDYFNPVEAPVLRLRQMLLWAQVPVAVVAVQHNEALPLWENHITKHKLTPPTHILHVDEHHDMMDDKKRTSLSNVIYHAMTRWQQCRVHWLVRDRIDDPSLWLEADTWDRLKKRFTMGARRPANWPRPDFVSVCTSPGFVKNDLRSALMREIKAHQLRKTIGRSRANSRD
jgi:hypothetical protein